MSLHVGTGKAAQANDLAEALARGRHDRQFFSYTFLNRILHDAQLEYVENANATVNCLATSNRWGKSTVLSNIHYHACLYKTGAEPRYLDESGLIDLKEFGRVKYHTIHTADEWETAAIVWDEALKLRSESPRLAAFIKDAPMSKPPHIDFITGSRWKFRTLHHDARGIDGNSFYVISIDECGWIDDLGAKMDNVVRLRIADVRGVVHLVGTFKPGTSKDFFKYNVRASAYTGRALTFDHRHDDDEGEASLDSSIRKYVREYIGRHVQAGKTVDQELADELAKLGISLDEFKDAIKS